MLSKVTIIILNWNGKKDTVECLESLKHITYPNYEILLVDNGSTDGSVEYFRERYPDIEIIENEKNMGYAEGNNVGIRKAMKNGADYVLLLNNDTVVDPEFLDELVKVAESDPGIGFAGPKVYYYDYNQKKDVINFAGGKLDMWKGKTYHIGLNEVDSGQYDEIKEVDYVEGSCLLLRKDVINEIGLLDPVYFAYWEENDLCMRGNKAGYISIFVPKAKIWHKISASNTNKNKIYYLTRNKFWFIKRYATWNQHLLFLLYFFIFQLWFTGGIIAVYHRDLKSLRSFLKAVSHGLMP
ncbi:MAG: glycosyltransferase family 2 protein [Candidatus Methanoperedens sp.]|nr:glycosyltransferase family 2 protein [Candidatus Methanoperedens sp.]